MNLIWRLDYSPSYSFMDKLGTVRRIVAETVPTYWSNVIDGNILHSFVASYQNVESGISREMSIEVQSLNGQFQWRSGTDLTQILQNEDFRNTNRIVQELLKISEVKDMRRSGIRFRGMGNFADGKRRAFQRFSNSIAKGVVTGVENAVGGNNDDLAVVFTGKTRDEISYRIQCGPSSQNDFITFFNNLEAIKN